MTTELQQKGTQIQRLAATIQLINAQMQQKEEELRQATFGLQQKDAELNRIQQNLQVSSFIVHAHSCMLNTLLTNHILITLCTYIQSLHADLENREARLRAQEEETKQRDAEISRLLGELRRCQAQLQEQQV